MRLIMKRLSLSPFAIITLLLISSTLSAQVQTDIRLISDKGIGSIDKNKEFIIDSISFDPFYDPNADSKFRTTASTVSTYVIAGSQGNKRFKVQARNFPRDLSSLKPVEDNLQNYWFTKNLSTLKVISEIKDLYKTRSDIEAEANEYINMLAKYDLIYDDPFLESYLYSIVTKIIPTNRADGFPYDIKVVLVRDESMNACVFPNGIMIVNTGLLAELHTEDELVAALSHEIAHFVGNHTLVNIRTMEKKVARAEFWAAFATAAAATTEIVAASQGNQYVNGTLTMNTAILSSAIASEVISRLGANFNKEQEKEADLMAMDVLGYLGYDKNAAASLFQRMTDAYNAEGNWAAYYLSGDHPSLRERIQYSGNPSSKQDPTFERKISFAVTDAAISKYNRGRFNQAYKLVSQNISNGVATDDDYLLKALCTLNLYSDLSHNREALSLVQQSKDLNANNANILRTEIIANLRCNDKNRASSLLNSYMNQLSDNMAKISDKESCTYQFYTNEFEWARKMSIKVKGL